MFSKSRKSQKVDDARKQINSGCRYG